MNTPYGREPTSQQQPIVIQAPRTNGMAVASLVLSLLWIFWIGSLVGLVLGIAALDQIDKDPTQTGRGLAIAGAIISGVSLLPLALIILAAA